MKQKTKQKIAEAAILLIKLPIIVVSNTIEAGFEAPQRWYNCLVKGKPFWSFIERKKWK